VVRVRRFAASGTAKEPYHLLRDGGLLETDDSRDRIFVSVEPPTGPSNAVEFALETAGPVRERKELRITSGNPGDPGSWVVTAPDDRHRDANGLWMGQLPSGSLTFSRVGAWFAGMTEVLTLRGLEAARAGSRITFYWFQD
jgi:hypothetical protein